MFVEIFVSLRTSLGLLRLAGTLTPASSCSFSSLVSKVRALGGVCGPATVFLCVCLCFSCVELPLYPLSVIAGGC